MHDSNLMPHGAEPGHKSLEQPSKPPPKETHIFLIAHEVSIAGPRVFYLSAQHFERHVGHLMPQSSQDLKLDMITVLVSIVCFDSEPGPANN